jgi:hypothetical protein
MGTALDMRLGCIGAGTRILPQHDAADGSSSRRRAPGPADASARPVFFR